MKRILAAACALLAAASAGAQTESPAQQIAGRLRANDLKADVSFLASDALEGRATPSHGLDIAAEYIAAQFRRAGLEPAGDDGYFQTAAFQAVTPNLDGLELTLETAGKTIKADKASMGLLDASALDLDQAPAIKVSMSDPAALDTLPPDETRGKALVIEIPDSGRNAFQAMRRIRSAAGRLQAALVVVVRSNGRGISEAARLASVSQPPIPMLVVWDAAFRNAVSGAKPGPVDARISAHIAAPAAAPVTLRNVIGVLRGADLSLKDTYVLLTAHYDHLGVRGSGPGDHIFNGANDDASGTSSVIEIASALASLAQPPRRSIVFLAFFGEELGLLGSRYYARRPVFPLAKTVADINLEQVGRTDDVTRPRVGEIDVTGFDYTSLTGEFLKAGKETGIRVVKDEENSDAFYAQSDNQAFADAGIPSHTLSVGYIFPDYHQPGDEWPKLDYENMAKVDRAIALAMLRIADSATAPEWNKQNPKTAAYVLARERGVPAQ